MWQNEKFRLFEGQYKEWCTNSIFDEFMSTLEYDSPFGNAFYRVLSTHPIDSKINILTNEIIELAKTVDSRVSHMLCNFAKMDIGQGIEWHNDYDDTAIARGIVYMNPVPMFGTRIADQDFATDYIEIGGNPGDFFVFSCSENTYHSAGFSETHTNRITLNISFYDHLHLPD